VRAGNTINALVVRSPGGGYPGPRGEPLEEYYRNEVIDGFGTFGMTAERGADFARAGRQNAARDCLRRQPADGPGCRPTW